MELVPPSPLLMSWDMCKLQHRTVATPPPLHPCPNIHTHTLYTHPLSPLTASLDQQKPFYQEMQYAADTGAKHNKVKIQLLITRQLRIPYYTAHEFNPICVRALCKQDGK